jgi:hypothetical protein
MGKTKDRFQELRERYVDTFHVPNEVFLRSTEYDIYMSTNKKLKEIKNIPYE